MSASLGPAARCICLGLAAIGALAIPGPSPAQQVPAPTAPTTDSVTLRPLRVSPRGALIRAMLVPGWGHAAIGSYTRGGLYFAIETTTAYALLRTRSRLSEARERALHREAIVRADLEDQGITDPVMVDAALEGDELLLSFEELVQSRERQQEDLVAFGIFLVLLTGADAYVSAHLARFPAPIEIESGMADDGRAEIGLSLRLPW